MVKRKRVESVRHDTSENHAALSLHDTTNSTSNSDGLLCEPQWQDELDALLASSGVDKRMDPHQRLLLLVDDEATEYPDWGLAEEQTYERRGGSPAPMQFATTLALAYADPRESDACVRHVPLVHAVHRSWASFLAYRRAYERRTRTFVVVASAVRVAQRNQQLLLANGDDTLIDAADELLLPRRVLVWQRVFVCSTADCAFTFTAEVTRVRGGQWVVLVKHGRFYHTHAPAPAASEARAKAESDDAETSDMRFVTAQIEVELLQLAPDDRDRELQSLTAYLSNLRRQRESVEMPPTPIALASGDEDGDDDDSALVTRRSSRRLSASVPSTSPVAKPTTRRKIPVANEKPANAETRLRARPNKPPFSDPPVPQRKSMRLRSEAETEAPSPMEEDTIRRSPRKKSKTQTPTDSHQEESNTPTSFSKREQVVSASTITREKTILQAAASRRRTSKTSNVSNVSKSSKASIRRVAITTTTTTTIGVSLETPTRKRSKTSAKDPAQQPQEYLKLYKTHQRALDNPTTLAKRTTPTPVQPPLPAAADADAGFAKQSENERSPRRLRRLNLNVVTTEIVPPPKTVAIESNRRSSQRTSTSRGTDDRTLTATLTNVALERCSLRKAPAASATHTMAAAKPTAPAEGTSRARKHQSSKPLVNSQHKATAPIPPRKAKKTVPPTALDRSARLAAASKISPLGPMQAWLSPTKPSAAPASDTATNATKRKKPMNDTNIRILKAVTVKKSKAASTATPMQVAISRISPMGLATDFTTNASASMNDHDHTGDDEWEIVLVPKLPTANTSRASATKRLATNKNATI